MFFLKSLSQNDIADMPDGSKVWCVWHKDGKAHEYTLRHRYNRVWAEEARFPIEVGESEFSTKAYREHPGE